MSDQTGCLCAVVDFWEYARWLNPVCVYCPRNYLDNLHHCLTINILEIKILSFNLFSFAFSLFMFFSTLWAQWCFIYFFILVIISLLLSLSLTYELKHFHDFCFFVFNRLPFILLWVSQLLIFIELYILLQYTR